MRSPSSWRRATRRGEWASLFTGGIGNDGATAWSAYSAITEWTNYRLPVRGQGPEALQRVESVLYGDAATLATSAETQLRQYVYQQQVD